MKRTYIELTVWLQSPVVGLYIRVVWTQCPKLKKTNKKKTKIQMILRHLLFKCWVPYEDGLMSLASALSL